jgi:Ca-activated chloride channel family protein
VKGDRTVKRRLLVFATALAVSTVVFAAEQAAPLSPGPATAPGAASPPAAPAPPAAAAPRQSPPSAQPPAQGPDLQRPSFRAGVEIVSLNVTVSDATNRYVTDLEPSEFSIFEDGVKQEVSFFSRRQQPIALSLLLDSSASMEDKLPTLQTAASNFVRRLKPNDIAQVIDFDSKVEIRQGFTGNQTELESAIGRMSSGGSTSLHNAIYIALKELRKVRAVSEEDVRRQALIVFSDGEDT